MAWLLGCFPELLTGKKKKVGQESTDDASGHARLVQPDKSFEESETTDNRNVEVRCGFAQGEDNEGEEGVVSIRKDSLDFNLGSHPAQDDSPLMEDAEVIGLEVDLAPSGHASDPGMREEIWASPTLERSCSNPETGKVTKKKKMMMGQRALSSSVSSQEQQKTEHGPGSPAASSVVTQFCAEKEILKKNSLSDLRPSGSRRLWRKLFLRSHRNPHRPSTANILQKTNPLKPLDQQGGYSPDAVEPNQQPKAATATKLKGKAKIDCAIDLNENGDWPLNQWLAFSISTPSSSLNRVDEWVKDLDHAESLPGADDQGSSDEALDYPLTPEMRVFQARDASHSRQCRGTNLSEEMLHTNHVTQSLSSSSTVARISGMGLKVVPSMPSFVSLRSVDLSGNSIVQISPGCLPRSLHVLNLSKNKISTIEGLRELTRLRVLDLSYNRISRIGRGLSSCALIKELFLAGNKISDVEGLHRLLKLSVLDLSFNKITTAKALGQFVANYNSLQALSLLGNPIMGNMGEEQLRKVVCGLLPKLAYLNKQPIKQQQRAGTESVAKAALGTSNRGSKRRRTRKVGRSKPDSSLRS